MKYHCCPAVTWCKDAKADNCDGCAVGKKIEELTAENAALRALVKELSPPPLGECIFLNKTLHTKQTGVSVHHEEVDK